MRTLRLLACALALLGGGATVVHAQQDYPSRPVRIIVPFPAGGGVDVLIRSVAAELSRRWGQAVVIDNRGGAGSLIGAEAVARSAPDGYTLMATINQTLTSNRFLYKSLPYDPDKGFAPVALMTTSDQFLIANPSVPAKDLRELVAAVRAQPGTLAYGSFGNGSQPHLVYELLKAKASLDITHVPYKGVAPVMTGLVGGEIQLATGSASVAGELLKAGKIKPLAVAGARRSTLFPDVPTTAEQGYPQLRAAVWYALVAPAGTPEAVIERIAADVKAILGEPEFARKNATARGLEVNAGGPAELRQAIRDDVAVTREMVQAAGVKPE
ncbi:Tripartite-type tricarboxylate transporter, receptor component TctC [Variovorax sp. PDC80]|nr:Tripartite-type tricarboxylate transporter, receptor component TctC [Variovorax sp. PDC80]